MSDPATEKALKALDQEVDRTADALSRAIITLRQHRKAAVRASNVRLADRIGAKLSEYGIALAALDKAKVAKLDKAPEIQKLIAGFKDATAQLKAAQKDIMDAKELIEKITKVVKVIGKIAKTALV